MAGRSRTTVSASVFEDFKPQFERKEEQEAFILTIHLPGFHSDQIKVTYVTSSRTIKVQGERAVAKNRRSRFNQSFPVPQNCIIEKIDGDFRNGVLTITMPKQTVTDQVGSVKGANATKETTPPKAMSQQKPMKDQKETTPPKVASMTGVEKQRADKIQPAQTPEKAINDDQPKASMVQMGPQQTAPPKVEALQPSKLEEQTQKKAAAAAIASTSKQSEEKTASSTSTAEIQPPQTPQKAVTDDQPKASMTEMGPQQHAPPKVEALQPSKLQEEEQKKAAAAAIASTSKQAEEKTASSTSTAEIQPPQTPQKAVTDDQPKASMAEMGPQQHAPPKVEALQPSKLQEEAQKKAAADIATATKQTEEKIAGSTSTAEIVEKKDESKVGFKDQLKEKESGKSEEDSTMYETNLPKIPAKGKKDDKAGGGGAAVEEKPKGAGSSSFLEKAKEMKGMDTIMKTVKRLAKDDYEDRQLLINMGVSVLVIVAVGAYITYRYRSYGKAKD